MAHHHRGARAIATATPAAIPAEISIWMPTPFARSSSQPGTPWVTIP